MEIVNPAAPKCEFLSITQTKEPGNQNDLNIENQEEHRQKEQAQRMSSHHKEQLQ